MSQGAEVPEALDAAFRPDAHELERTVCAEADGIDSLGAMLGRHVLARRGDRLAERAQLGTICRSRDLGEMRDIEEVTESGGGGGKSEHLRLQPLVTRGAVAAQNALHETNNTRNARNVKNFLQIFFEGAAMPSNSALCVMRAAETSQSASAGHVAARWCLLITCCLRLSPSPLRLSCGLYGNSSLLTSTRLKHSHVALRMG